MMQELLKRPEASAGVFLVHQLHIDADIKFDPRKDTSRENIRTNISPEWPLNSLPVVPMPPATCSFCLHVLEIRTKNLQLFAPLCRSVRSDLQHIYCSVNAASCLRLPLFLLPSLPLLSALCIFIHFSLKDPKVFQI